MSWVIGLLSAGLIAVGLAYVLTQQATVELRVGAGGTGNFAAVSGGPRWGAHRGPRAAGEDPPPPPTTPPSSPPPVLASATAQQRVSPATDTCGAVIAEVEARGLYPAPGFTVVCPGYALGHEGMTCMNVPSVCPGHAEIVIHYVRAFVVANEFENSRIFAGVPARCETIDCGHAAYGFGVA